MAATSSTDDLFLVSDDCISCGACSDIAPENFAQRPGSSMYQVIAQPRSEEEREQCLQAMEVCPAAAISSASSGAPEPEAPAVAPPVEGARFIVAASNVRETLESNPAIRQALQDLSPIFKRMENKVLWNTVARFATFRDVARVSRISLCEILHVVNKANGTYEGFHQRFPECLASGPAVMDEEQTWSDEGANVLDLRDREEAWLEQAVERIHSVAPGQTLLILSHRELDPLMAVAREDGCQVARSRRGPDMRLSIHRPEQEDWMARAGGYDTLDVRAMLTDPFDVIMKKAYAVPEGSGFILVQTFKPDPLINMLSAMDFDHHVEEKGYGETWVYFHKRRTHAQASGSGERLPIVVQSATPVAYPVIMRLLQSERLRERVDIVELKVWEKTEQHLGWVVSGKADVSFSAVITSTKLVNHDVVMPAVFVWDNFYLLTRGYEAKHLSDLAGRTIHAPLFKEAPPTAITRYLIKSLGLNEDDYSFKYGTPFGRPEEILRDFLAGRSDTVLLREPEASFAIAGIRGRAPWSVISFNDLWNEVNPGYGSFPNAGLLFKGALVREHPEIARLVTEEVAAAVDWVNANRDAAARLSFDMMRASQDNVRLFLDRVRFEVVSGEPLVKSVTDYLGLLREQGIVTADLPDDFSRMFLLEGANRREG